MGVAFFLYATLKERRLNALKSDFIANVSHELKTPLSVVRMFAEMLLTERVASPEKQRQYLEMICRESERLSGLIENVLDFAALERGKQNYAPRGGRPGGDRGARRWRPCASGSSSVEVRVHLPERRCRACSVDAQAVLLAVINLLDNAVKYGEGTPIDVSVLVQRTRALCIRCAIAGRAFPATRCGACSIASIACAGRASRCAARASACRWSSTSPTPTAGAPGPRTRPTAAPS